MSRSSRSRRSRVALVLAGGGVAGAVYEIGALRALDDLLVDRTTNDFDIYVGTSAGALVSAMLANGLSPELMLRALEGKHPHVRELRHADIMSLGRLGLLTSFGRRLPNVLVSTGRRYLSHREDATVFDLLWSLAAALPAGLYDPMALERYVRDVLESLGRTNRFADLATELFIVATELDTGRRAVFGPGHRQDQTISLAVAASTALPLLYRPVRIGSREYVDGGLHGTASLDLAIEAGAQLVICINPLVPHEGADTEPAAARKGAGAVPESYLDGNGLQTVAAQVSRIALQAGLHYHIKQLRRRHPDVDILLIEPPADDARAYYYNIMRYSQRQNIARTGFESVGLQLAETCPSVNEVFDRHGIATDCAPLQAELEELQRGGYDSAALRRVLAKRSSQRRGRRRLIRSTPELRLQRTLADLEATLGEME